MKIAYVYDFYSSRRRCLGEPCMFFASFVVVVVVVAVVVGVTLSDFMQVWVQRFHAGVGPASYLCVVNSHLDSLRVFAFHSNLCVYFTHHFDRLYMYAVGLFGFVGHI